MMAAPVTAPSVHLRPGSTRRAGAGRLLAAVTSTLLLSNCYGADFFKRLVDPTDTGAFRITRLTLIDPHVYSGNDVQCMDSSDALNDIFAENIRSFDVNTTLVLHPLDPLVATQTRMEIVPAKCVPGGERVNCTDKDVPIAEIVSADFNNSVGGTCGNPVADSLNPKYQGGGNEALHQAMSPCFLSAPIPKLGLKLATDVSLPLSNVQIYATYALTEESEELVSGVIFGFVPASVAMLPIGDLGGGPFVLWSSLSGGGSCKKPQPPELDDIDTLALEDGVWMYFNFTAERVAWSSENDMPGTSGEPDTTDPTTAALTTDATTGLTTGLTTGATTGASFTATDATTSGSSATDFTTSTATDFTTSTATITAGT